MNEVYLVMKSDRHKFYVMKDVFNSDRTYKHRPVAIFLSKEDAWDYANLKNNRPSLFEVKRSNHFDEDDCPENIWAIENGYL